MKKIIGILVFLALFVSCKSNNPINVADEKKLAVAMIDFLQFETYWSGRWSKSGYWHTNVLSELFKKDKVKVTYYYNKSNNCYKIFIDELRSVIYVTDENGFYYVNSSDDTWWKEADTSEFNNIKVDACKPGCKSSEISMADEVGKRAISMPGKEMQEKIKLIVTKDVVEKENYSFICDLLKKFGITKIEVKIGISQLSFPGIYYFVEGLPYMGHIIYNPQNSSILFSSFFYWKELPDRKHYENIHKQIENNCLNLNIPK